MVCYSAPVCPRRISKAIDGESVSALRETDPEQYRSWCMLLRSDADGVRTASQRSHVRTCIAELVAETRTSRVR